MAIKYIQIVKGHAYYRRGFYRAKLPPVGSPQFEEAYAAAKAEGDRIEAMVRGGEFRSGGRRLSAKLASACQNRAMAKKIPHKLTSSDIEALMASQQYKCALTGMPFSDEKVGSSGPRPYLPSVDRIDPAKGYTRGNVRIVCSIANLARNSFGDDVFYKMCRSAASVAAKRKL